MKLIPCKNVIEEGIFLAYKPLGLSSFGFLSRLRRVFGIKKIGHAGTLDPLAEGLMIVGYGKGTKKLTTYIKQDKVYVAEFLLGKQTTTGDLEGLVLESVSINKDTINVTDLKKSLEDMEGEHTIAVPLYSAIKVLGKPLYEYARKGIVPPYIPQKEMNIFDIQYLESYQEGDCCIVKARIHVSSGTYIRALAEEYGKRLGLPATLKSLIRTHIGDYSIEHAYSLEKPKKHFYATLRLLFKKIYLQCIRFFKRI